MANKSVFTRMSEALFGKKEQTNKIEEVNKVLFDDKPAKEGVKDLMVREKRVEHLNLKWEN